MTRLISIMIILILVVVTGLVLALDRRERCGPNPRPRAGAFATERTYADPDSHADRRIHARNRGPRPGAGSRPVSDNNPTAWQASGPTSRLDADPLTEAGRWELFGGGGTLNDVFFFVDSAYGWSAGTAVWKTIDGGARWRRLPEPVGGTSPRSHHLRRPQPGLGPGRLRRRAADRGRRRDLGGHPRRQ